MPPEALQPLTVSAFSDEVQEIMARPPHWLLRWGITVVALTVGVLVLVSWMIRYPDVIPAEISVTGSNPPVQIVARESGHLSELRVGPDQEVSRGELLAIIESPTEAARVFEIGAQLDALAPSLAEPDSLAAIEFTTVGQLGALEAPYTDFYSEYRNYRSLLEDDYTEKTAALLGSQLERKQNQVENMKRQREAVGRELELAELRYERIKALSERDSVSLAQLESEESTLLAQRRQGVAVDNQLNEEEIAVVALERQIRDLEHQRSESLRESHARLLDRTHRLAAAIELWESNYVLRSPTDGKVAFYDFWSDQQYVTAGSQVFTIDPGSVDLVGRIEVKRAGAGKIESGHLVRIKFDDYPYKEFGVVTGIVSAVSLVAREGAHLVTVEIDYPLVTSFRRELPFKQGMTGEATVVTQERRLLQRIFEELLRAFDQAGGGGSKGGGNSG